MNNSNPIEKDIRNCTVGDYVIFSISDFCRSPILLTEDLGYEFKGVSKVSSGHTNTHYIVKGNTLGTLWRYATDEEIEFNLHQDLI